MLRLIFPPDQASYSFVDGEEVVRVQLSGGRGRYRRDTLNASKDVTVSWTVSPEKYKYLRAFYATAVLRTSERFIVSLVLDGPFQEDYEANFVPNSMQLQSLTGHTYVVTAKLEAVSKVRDNTLDDYFVNLYGEFSGMSFELAIDRLDQIVNITMPEALS